MYGKRWDLAFADTGRIRLDESWQSWTPQVYILCLGNGQRGVELRQRTVDGRILVPFVLQFGFVQLNVLLTDAKQLNEPCPRAAAKVITHLNDNGVDHVPAGSESIKMRNISTETTTGEMHCGNICKSDPTAACAR